MAEIMGETSDLAVEVTLPRHVIEAIDLLIKEGVYGSRSEAIARLVEAHLELIFEGEELEVFARG